MDEPKFRLDDMLFGSIELHEAPARVEGRFLYPRGRRIIRDRRGNVTLDETYDTGTRLENWESVAHLFGVEAPKRTWWQRLSDWL